MTHAGSQTLPRSAIHRIVCAVVVGETARLRGSARGAGVQAPWPEEALLDDSGLCLDSLERLGALAALAETFVIDDALVSQEPAQTVGDWIDWIMLTHGKRGAHLAVRTSGTTGVATVCDHPVVTLMEEARYFAASLPTCRRIVSLVPAHHLYGIIWTALLPAVLDVPVVVQSLESPLRLTAGDLIVAVPEQWGMLSHVVRRFPAGVAGVNSAGSLEADVARRLLAAGLDRLIDVYGSSETGAIAEREMPTSSYCLLPRWRLIDTRQGELGLQEQDGEVRHVPDLVGRVSEREIVLLGRRDGMVQVGGCNVSPTHVRDVLLTLDGVVEAAVRLHISGRLKAFIVLGADQDRAVVTRLIEAACASSLTAPERPCTLQFGSALPRNAMGKLEDWA